MTAQRPDLFSPIVTRFPELEENHSELVAPGYFFISPYDQVQEGPYIYDNDGVRIRSKHLSIQH